MQQRRLRLGDILDDYCPRERRLTNHAVVAMIDDEVRQTRCTTCDADHEYRHGKVLPLKKKKDANPLAPEATTAEVSPRVAPAPVTAAEPSVPEVPVDAAAELTPPVDEPQSVSLADDEGPVHRRLIRATLPRPEGQVPERREPDFTVRQPGSGNGREGQNRPGGPRRARGRRQRGPHAGGQVGLFGNESKGQPGRQDRGDVNGNRAPSGQRVDGRPDGGRGRGPRQGSDQGRKRGR